MPTEIVHTIAASGGDYTSLEAWQTAQARDLVAADEIAVAEVRNDWPNGLPTKLTLSGWATDAAHYVEIRPAPGHRHTGRAHTGAALTVQSVANWQRILDLGLPHVRVRGLELRCIPNTGCTGAKVHADGVHVEACIFVGSCAPSGAGIAIYGDSSDACYVGGNLFVESLGQADLTGAPIRFYDAQQRIAAWVVNNTIIADGGSQPGAGILVYNQATSANKHIRNNAVLGFAAGLSYQTGPVDTANNATSDTSGEITGLGAADFVDAANGDYHLSAASILRGAGANLSADYPSLVDMDGQPWPDTGPWDIGADSAQQATGTDLSGSGQSVAGGTGAVTYSVPLIGAAVVVSGASGTISTTIPLAGAAAAVSAGHGDLGATVSLGGGAIAQAMGAAGLTSLLPLDGAAQGAAAGIGSITLQLRFSGQAVSEALAAAGLSTAGTDLSGSAGAESQGGGSLTTVIPISGAALSLTSAAGDLVTEIPLIGAAASASAGVGTLDLGLTLAGAALAQAAGSATITMSVRLAGAALAQAAAAGRLVTGGYRPAPTARRVRVAAESRRLRVAPEPRRIAA